MIDDLNEQLGKLALMAETANHWTDEHRLMPAAGVADIVYDAIQRIEELEAKLAWAVGELEEMLMFQNSEAAYGILRVYTKALLAELKGQDDD